MSFKTKEVNIDNFGWLDLKFEISAQTFPEGKPGPVIRSDLTIHITPAKGGMINAEVKVDFGSCEAGNVDQVLAKLKLWMEATAKEIPLPGIIQPWFPFIK